jgi:membrane protein
VKRRWPLVSLLRDVLRWLLTLEVIDRSLVVGAQAFSALIPLLIVLASAGSKDGNSFADTLIRRFDLSGDAADAVRETFAAPAEGATLTVLGVLLVVYSALAFTRALQRTFELAWGLQRRGMRNTGYGLLWLCLLTAYVTLFGALQDWLPDRLAAILGIGGSFALWLVSPYLLLARRVPWRTLIPQAALTAVGLVALSIGFAIYVPRAMSTSAEQFGAIGVAFTLLAVLWAAGFVIVCAAGIGAFIGRPAARLGVPPAARSRDPEVVAAPHAARPGR